MSGVNRGTTLRSVDGDAGTLHTFLMAISRFPQVAVPCGGIALLYHRVLRLIFRKTLCSERFHSTEHASQFIRGDVVEI